MRYFCLEGVAEAINNKERDMRELVEYIIRKIANNPDEVQVRQEEGRETAILEVFLAEDDRDKIIGKGGSLANALRVIVEEVARKLGKRVIIRILEN